MTDLDLPQLAKNAFPGLPNWLSALKLAANGRCDTALQIASHLDNPAAGLDRRSHWQSLG